MKILIGVFTGMLLGGGGVWAFHDSRPLESYQSPVTPFAHFSTLEDTPTEDLKRNTGSSRPCKP